MSVSIAVSTSKVRVSYSKLTQHLKKISAVSSVKAVLDWDQQINLPKLGAEARGYQSSVIAGIEHDLKTSSSLGDIIKELSSYSNDELAELNEYERKNISLAAKDYEKTVKIPKELSEEMAELNSSGYFAWAEAKKSNDFSKFQPYLEKWINARKIMASKIDPNRDPYDVCMEEFDRECDSSKIDALFEDLKKELIPIIHKVLEAKKANPLDLSSINGNFPISVQETLNKKIAGDLGFDFDSGRLDVSLHPFTTNFDRNDVRISTRYRTDDFAQGLYGTIHETGHALYEQGRNAEHYGTTVAEALGMSLHESQSLLWERHVGLSKDFITRYWPTIKSSFLEFNPHFNNVTADDLYKAVNNVEASFIRVEADELTYPLHVILRYELEKGIFNNKIDVKDLPRLWNEKMNHYLGIVPENDSKGVLQDVHWSCGLFGYFPSYLIGAIAAAQIFNAASNKIPDFNNQLVNGNYAVLKQFLNENIHKKGSLRNLDSLLVEVTGEPLTYKHFLNNLRTKYSEIFKIQL